MRAFLIAIGCIILLLVIYSIIDPTSSDFAPKCIFHFLTGFDCPACGIQRFIHTLIHSDFTHAIRYNYFLLISLPYFFAVTITTFGKSQTAVKASYYVQHPIVVKIFVVLTVIWWIARNIPAVKTSLNML